MSGSGFSFDAADVRKVIAVLERIAVALERANEANPILAIERALAGPVEDARPGIERDMLTRREEAGAVLAKGESLLPPDEMWRCR